VAKGHIIPEFYLKLFLDPNIPLNKSQELFYYDFDKTTWGRRPPSSLGYIEDYYILTEKEIHEYDMIEKAFQKVESEAAKIIKEKITQRAALTEDEKNAFAEFAVLMRTRVTSFIDFLSKNFTDIKKKVSDKVEDTDEQLIEEVKTLIATSSKKSREILLALNWSFLHSAGDDYFITSDNPYYLTDKRRPNGMHSLGHRDPNNYVTLPLTRNICFFASHEKDFDLHQDIGNNIVALQNFQRIASARNRIFCPMQKFPGDNYINLRMASKK